MPARPFSSVPRGVRCALALALLLQIGWHAGHRPQAARASALPPAPSMALLQLASLGEPVALSKAMMLYLQGYDDQAGVSLSWKSMDYPTVRDWLERALALDPRAQYPLLAASEVYGAVGDPARVRLMLDFVYRRFGADPDRRWPWLAQAALVARHRLGDLPLARKYAQAIREQARGPGVPAWAREMEVFIAEDMNELDSAKTLIGGLLRSGRITDPHELQFLSQRLDQIAARQAAQGARQGAR
ncbi:MAG TPA: hypothetical protein VGP06_19640 [Janthinobacterium sp.]|jgi:hypothetical protein|nr:hypothetical protein [Janthinobacterium sp.]